MEPASGVLLSRGAFLVGLSLRVTGGRVSGEGDSLHSGGLSDYSPVLAPFRVEH